MRRLALVALLIAPPLLAQADLSITPRENEPTWFVGRTARVAFFVINKGPGAAVNVHVHFQVEGARIDRSSVVDGANCTDDCPIGDVSPSGFRFLEADVIPPVPASAVRVTATITSDSTDPDLTNNTATWTFEAIDAPELSSYINPSEFNYRPEQRGRVRATAYNEGTIVATGVELVVDLPDGSKPVKVSADDGFACAIDGARVVCHADTLPLLTFEEVVIDFINPPLYEGGRVKATSHIESAEREINTRNNDANTDWNIPQFFKVTNSDDDGPGSLRDGLLLANAGCRAFSRCMVGLRIPGPLPPSGFFTIRPQSPLPPMSFYGTLDGSAEVDILGGDFMTPLVMLDGSQQPDGDGLQLVSTEQGAITGIAAGNFPRFGIFVGAGTQKYASANLVDVYLGVDPTGHTAAPNLRGIYTGETVSLEMFRCVVSANRRSGIAASGPLRVETCRIGVAADSDAPMPNGASGIYAPNASEVDVSDGVIAYNHDAALALNPTLHQVEINRTSIFRNGGGIDYGLDGRTPNVPDDSHRPPNMPILSNAHFDRSIGKTVVTVEIRSNAPPPAFQGADHGGTSFAASIYANDDADPQAQRFLRFVSPGIVQLDGDLRGQFLTAMAFRFRVDCWEDVCYTRNETSEISDAVPVR